MSILQQLITRQITEAAIHHAQEQGQQGTGERKVYMAPFYKRFFTVVLVLGAVICLGIPFLGCPLTGALVTLGIILLVCIPLLIGIHNTWFTWDDQGFTVSTFSGRQRRFGYEDILSLQNLEQGGQLITKLKFSGNHKATLDSSWVNREDFLHAIYDHRRDLFS